MAQLLLITGNNNNVIIVMSSGFVITSILWGQITLQIVDSKQIETFICFIILSFLTFFGFIHSLDGNVFYDIWNQNYLQWCFALGYLVCGFLSFFFISSTTTNNYDDKNKKNNNNKNKIGSLIDWEKLETRVKNIRKGILFSNTINSKYASNDSDNVDIYK
jgi:hypothetical protein